MADYSLNPRNSPARNAHEAPARLTHLQQAAVANENLFDEPMETVKFCSLGQITNALFEVGGSIEGICRFRI